MNNLYQEVIKPVGNDLASRASAIKVRHIVENTINNGKSVSVDLAGVLSISESYADELFAVLVEKYGLEWFSSHIKLSNHSPNLLLSVATAIKRRLEKKKESLTRDSIDNLIAAKRKYDTHNKASRYA
jgi:hypothetical protein